ncbi:MAG TPA: hypothetical protein V6D23_22130 [Candidatus Obscuribacterales bacterium]
MAQGAPHLNGPEATQRYQNLEQALPQLGGGVQSPANPTGPASPTSPTPPTPEDLSIGGNRTGFRAGEHRRLEGSGGVQAGQWVSDGQQVQGLNVGGSATARVGTGTDFNSRGAGGEAAAGTGGASATRTTAVDGNGEATSMYGASVGTPGASAGVYGNTGPNPDSSSDIRARAALGVGTGLGVRIGQTDVDQDGVRENCIGIDVGPFSGDICAEGEPAQGAINQINRVAAQEEAERRLARGQQPAPAGHDGSTVHERRVNASMRHIQTERAAERQNRPPANPNDPMNRNPLTAPPARAADVRPGSVNAAGQTTPQFVPLRDMNPDGTFMSPGQRAARDLQAGILPP